jgi:hypothetical protein
LISSICISFSWYFDKVYHREHKYSSCREMIWIVDWWPRICNTCFALTLLLAFCEPWGRYLLSCRTFRLGIKWYSFKGLDHLCTGIQDCRAAGRLCFSSSVKNHPLLSFLLRTHSVETAAFLVSMIVVIDIKKQNLLRFHWVDFYLGLLIQLINFAQC